LGNSLKSIITKFTVLRISVVVTVGQRAVPLTDAYMPTTLVDSNLMIYWEQYALVIARSTTRV